VKLLYYGVANLSIQADSTLMKSGSIPPDSSVLPCFWGQLSRWIRCKNRCTMGANM